MVRHFQQPARSVLIIGGTSIFNDKLIAHLLQDGTLRLSLCDDGHSGGAAARAGGNPFDAVVIATQLPDGSGVWLCHSLRHDGFTLPILLVAERTREGDIVAGLDAGANDFMTMPVRPAELSARLHAQIRAYERSEEASLTIGRFRFRPAMRELQSLTGPLRVGLTEKETAVLRFLCRAEGPVSRETLLMEVWGYSGTSNSHTVETHIYRLRRKIEPDPHRIMLLVNENGGYRLRREIELEPADGRHDHVELVAS
jgi:DNA-binding response OmpR family regulator